MAKQSTVEEAKKDFAPQEKVVKTAVVDKAGKAGEVDEADKANSKKEAEIERIKKAQTGSYVPVVKERHLFHVQLEKTRFDPKTGERLSKPFLQKFTIPEWKHTLKNSKGLGFEMKIMWNPEEYITD